jgi:hypothetical protein
MLTIWFLITFITSSLNVVAATLFSCAGSRQEKEEIMRKNRKAPYIKINE